MARAWPHRDRPGGAMAPPTGTLGVTGLPPLGSS